MLAVSHMEALQKINYVKKEKGDGGSLNWTKSKSRSQHTSERLVLCLGNMQNQPANAAFVFP